MEYYTVRFDSYSTRSFRGTLIAYLATNTGEGFASVRHCSVYKTDDNQYLCSVVEHIDGLQPFYKSGIYFNKEGILDFFGKDVVGYRIMWLVNDCELGNRQVA